MNELEEEGASCTNTVVFVGRNEDNCEVSTIAIHKAPFTTSNLVSKGIVMDSAKVLSKGLVKIEENAFGSNGYEKQDVLVLSEKAQAKAIPDLEIHNHDVKCSHGSTIGKIDAEAIFYLMSRGLNKKAAEKKIVEGYFGELYPLVKEVLK